MKDEESQMVFTTAATITSTATTATYASAKKDGYSGSDGGLFGRGKYKLWALAAIILLALWSMFTGSVTLKWSAGNLNHVSDEFDSTSHDDLDILEVEEREKVVKRMWDIYTHSSVIRLPNFWQAAFKAAYEDLTSEAPVIRSSAISEIAKMSFSSSRSYDVEFEQPPDIESNNRTSKIRTDSKLSQLGKTRRQK